MLLLISDGAPTDNWEKGLNQIKKNNWFRHAIKIAIDIESSAEKSVLKAFTGNPEAVLDAKNTAILKKMIHKVSVRASEFQSHSKRAGDSLGSPEEDSAGIVDSVVADLEAESSNGVSDADWGEW